MLLPVSPDLNFWYYLAIISSFSWVLSSLAMDFIKKTTRPVSVFLISTLVLSWFTSNSVLSKFYFSLQRNPQADRFFHGYEGAGKTIGYVLLLFGNVGLYYFSEKSVACMFTFLFLSFYCLCCRLCIQPYTDFGILDFLLSATLNETLNLLGLRSSSTWLVVVACIGIAGLRYCLEPLHTPGEATSDEADQLESGQLLPHGEPPSLGAQLANEDTTQFGCIRSTNPILERWRLATLVLNASRRFRYILDLKKEEEKKQTIRKIRAHAQVTRAAFLFQKAGQKEKVSGAPGLATTSAGDYSINQEQLASITRDHDFSALEDLGGVKGLADTLETSVEKGICGDDDDLLKRKNAFGSNTYPQKKGRGFWNFVWDACRDTTLIILVVAAAASLWLGIKTEGIKDGWYDGGSIALAVLIVIIVTAASDYKQFLLFQNLNEEKQNIHLEVIRGGRRMEVSIFDLVVGDVVPLKIGDQVPADGILISGQSLAIDESSMTGESKIVQKGPKAPFLMSGCKVADGFGTMLVTSVGINTKWGLLMVSISEDNGEETPLQVRLKGVATFIGFVGLTVSVVVLVVLIIRFFTGHSKNSDGTVQFTPGKTKFSTAIDGAIKIFTVAVAIVFIAVPEGLPLAVTITLAYSMRKMMADKALVRRLSACETMGSATTICSDKTGTLTLNQMTVVEAYVGGEKAESPDNGSVLPPKVKSLLIEGIAQNTTGSVFVPEDGGKMEISGSPTEKSILQWGINVALLLSLLNGFLFSYVSNEQI